MVLSQNNASDNDAQRSRGKPRQDVPAFSQLLLARTGALWVRTYVTQDGFPSNRWRMNAVPSDWSIYDGQGRWIAPCRLPPRFAPVEVGADYVLGVSLDADDVERVTIWTLRR